MALPHISASNYALGSDCVCVCACVLVCLCVCVYGECMLLIVVAKVPIFEGMFLYASLLDIRPIIQIVVLIHLWML